MQCATILVSVTLRSFVNSGKQQLLQNPTKNIVASIKNIHASSSQCFKPRCVAPTLMELQRRKKKEIALNGGKIVNPRNSFLEWNYDAEIYAFQKRLNESFDNALLRQSFTHSSYVYEETKKQQALGINTPLQLLDNRTLAEEGKALVERFLYGYLRASLPNLPKEGIQIIQTFLMDPDLHAHIAKHLGMSELILCSVDPPSKEILTTCLHAIVSCVNRSSGEDQARRFVYDFIAVQLADKSVADLWQPVNPMGVLVDVLQKMGNGEPEPRLIRKTGVNTILATYHVGVYSNKQLIGSAPGESPEIAEELAARDALSRLFGIQHEMNPLEFGVYLTDATKQQAVQLESRPKAQFIS